MNYRHAFHAGNFADVFKHALLAHILVYLCNKDSAFRVVDTHAGAGRYDLTSVEAGRTGEWRDGIGRLLATPLKREVAELFAPYLAAVRSECSDETPSKYPGSPLIALKLTRPQDRLVFCELHPEERAALATAIGRDRRASIVDADGWTALKAALPPPERRGLVLIDPPFEEPGDFRRFEDGLIAAYRRWPTGIYLFWYPIKNPRETNAFVRRIARLGIAKILRVELTVAAPAADRLVSCGILLINPPWTLESDLAMLMPVLVATLARDATAGYSIGWLTGDMP